jgi:glycosyltransferase involved in cell wall biosynthesis
MHILISALNRFTQPTGICRYAANLARSLSDLPQISKVTLLIGSWQEEYFRTSFDINSRKTEVIPVPVFNTTLARNLWYVFELPKIAKSSEADIVHLGFPVPILKWRFPCPIVATFHDLYPYDLPESFGRIDGFSKRMMMRQCLGACDAVTCVSESTLGALNRHFPRLPSRVPVGLVHNYAEFSSLVDAPSFNADPRPFLLTVAQHRPNKRLDLMLRAFAELRSKEQGGEKLKLMVVGSEGPESNALRELAKSLQVDSFVHWLPKLSDGELAWMYQNCEAFIVSSRIEGFCLPLLEALLFNCRIVASDIPVFHEIAGDYPAYFDSARDAVKNLTAAVLHALKAPPREIQPTLSFSRERTARECMAMYSCLLPKFAAGADGTAHVVSLASAKNSSQTEVTKCGDPN